MFSTPIKHVPLRSMEELLKFSYRTNDRSEHKLIVTQNNGQIAFADEYGYVYVTPYRPEIHDVLKKAGYTERYSLFVPFSNGEERPQAYQWLAQIANEECWAYTHEKAFDFSKEKGIMPVSLNHNCHVKEITSCYDDKDNHLLIQSLTMMYLLNETQNNIGTYIVIDEKTLLVCDEYGRTFLIKVKTVINDIVNQLIEAGYTRTPYPEQYVGKYVPEDDPSAD